MNLRLAGLLLVLAGISCRASALDAASLAGRVGFDQHPGLALPLQLVLRDSRGAPHPLGSYFGRNPVAMMFGYYHCRKLCSTAIDEFAHSADAAQLGGDHYEFIFVSIDPRETPRDAASQRAAYVRSFSDIGADRWHFLTADDRTVQTLAQAAGVRYVYDSHDDQYAHPAGIIVATPAGRIARYLQGVVIPPAMLRTGLAAAAAGRIGKPVPPLLLLCYQYDPSTGRYGLATMRLIQAGALATVLVLAATIVRRRRRRPC